MDNKFYISLEAARLLKEKGYNEECEQIIKEDGEILYGYNVNYKLPVTLFSYPTKSEAIDWLDSKGLIIDTSFYFSRGRWSADIRRNDSWAYVALGEYYSTRLEAEEAAIIKALELL